MYNQKLHVTKKCKSWSETERVSKPFSTLFLCLTWLRWIVIFCVDGIGRGSCTPEVFVLMPYPLESISAGLSLTAASTQILHDILKYHSHVPAPMLQGVSIFYPHWHTCHSVSVFSSFSTIHLTHRFQGRPGVPPLVPSHESHLSSSSDSYARRFIFHDIPSADTDPVDCNISFSELFFAYHHYSTTTVVAGDITTISNILVAFIRGCKPPHHSNNCCTHIRTCTQTHTHIHVLFTQ